MSDFGAASATVPSIEPGPGQSLPAAAGPIPVLHAVHATGLDAEVPDAWWPILLRLGLAHETISKLLRLAAANGTSF